MEVIPRSSSRGERDSGLCQGVLVGEEDMQREARRRENHS